MKSSKRRHETKKPSHKNYPAAEAAKRKKKQSLKRSRKRPADSAPSIHKKASSKKLPPKKRTAATKKRRKRRNQRLRNLGKELGVSILIGGSLLILITQLLLAFPKVNGYGMTMTLSDQDRVLVNKHSRIKRFDLVYFRHPLTGEKMIRRIIGLPGESLNYKEELLWVDGEIKPERFLAPSIEMVEKEGQSYTEDFTLREIINAAEIPKNHYFVLGDNRRYTVDSRDFGLIAQEDVIGVVKLQILPLHQMQAF